MNRFMRFIRTNTGMLLLVGLMAAGTSCAPKEPIQFRSVRSITVQTDSLGAPVLRGEAVFYNPNKLRMKLKEVKMEVLVDGKQSATVDQKPALIIPAVAEFTVPVEAHLSLQNFGLVDAVMNLFGGKKYAIEYNGFVRVRVHGVTVKVPVHFNDQLKLR